MINYSETHVHHRLPETQITWDVGSATLLQQSVEIPDRTGKNKWRCFRFENLGENSKRKGWAREYVILLGLLTLLKCEFRESPTAGNNLMKEMKRGGLSKEGPL